MKKKYGLIEDAEVISTPKVQPEKEAAILEAFVQFGLLKEKRNFARASV